MGTKNDLRNYLVDTGIIKSPRLEHAFSKIDRADFVLPSYKDIAYQDHPLPIGFGQSISQPSTVAFMLQLLKPSKEQVILDIGSGSGWTAALLAEAVGPKGRIYSVEIIPEMLEFARLNLKKYKFENISLKPSGSRLGLPEYSPYHKILVSAEAPDLPPILLNQLATGGTLVLPVAGNIVQIDKISEELLESTAFPAFAFVPLQ